MAAILAWFEATQPDPKSELHYSNPFELLVAVVLSAQCTDKRVNQITPALFDRFPTATDMSHGRQEELFELIKSCSYPNNKAKHLHEMSIRLVEHFGGEVPRTTAELETLPGVGRKTANVLVSVLDDAPALAVDTHVFRVSARLGFTPASKSPQETERVLMGLIPRHLVARSHHWLILHGRYVCTARKPHCEGCGIRDFCPSFSTTPSR